MTSSVVMTDPFWRTSLASPYLFLSGGMQVRLKPGPHLPFVTAGMACSPGFPAAAAKPSASVHTTPCPCQPWHLQCQRGEAPLHSAGVVLPQGSHSLPHTGGHPGHLRQGSPGAMGIPSAGDDVIIADNDLEGPQIFPSVGQQRRPRKRAPTPPSPTGRPEPPPALLPPA